MPSKKISREEALAWAKQGEPAPSVLACGEAPSRASVHAAAILVGHSAPDCVSRIASRFARMEAFFASGASLAEIQLNQPTPAPRRKHG